MAEKYCICITNAPVAEYCPTAYLTEEFGSDSDAEARFAELAKSFSADWPEGYELWLGAYYGGGHWSTVKDIVNW